MTNYKKQYDKIFSALSDDDKLAFNSLDKEFDKNFVTEQAKYEKLYIMADSMVKSGKDYVDYYNAKTKDVARVASKDLPKYRNKFWPDVTILTFYFAVLYSVTIFFFGEIVISLVLPLVFLMILAMVPFMNNGIKHQTSKRGNQQMFSTIMFLVLFIGANLLILFMNSNALSVLKITAYDASLVDTILFVVFIIIAAASIYFMLVSEAWNTKLIFLVLLIYSAGRIIYPFDFLNGMSEFIVNYFMFIGLVVVLIAQFVKARQVNNNE